MITEPMVRVKFKSGKFAGQGEFRINKKEYAANPTAYELVGGPRESEPKPVVPVTSVPKARSRKR
jgi:hypothetical protein